MFWPTRARVPETKSKELTGSFVEEAITQTTDVVSGSESIPSRPGMNKTKQQSWRSDLKESQVDPPEVDEDRGSVTKNAHESIILEVIYSQRTQAWLPNLRVGKCNIIKSRLFF